MVSFGFERKKVIVFFEEGCPKWAPDHEHLGTSAHCQLRSDQVRSAAIWTAGARDRHNGWPRSRQRDWLRLGGPAIRTEVGGPEARVGVQPDCAVNPCDEGDEERSTNRLIHAILATVSLVACLANNCISRSLCAFLAQATCPCPSVCQVTGAGHLNHPRQRALPCGQLPRVHETDLRGKA